jgi:hypothetical protein
MHCRQHQAVKKQIFLAIVLTAIALLDGCAMFRETPQNSLVGTWTNPLGTVWALKDDGTFEVALNNSNQPSIWGKYSIADDTITIKGSRGLQIPKSCNGEGVYKFNRDRDKLTFTLVSDKCRLRTKNVLLPWKPWIGK